MIRMYTILVVATGLLTMVLPAQGQMRADHLEMLSPPVLLQCNDPRAYFRATLTAEDSARQTASIDIGNGDARKLFDVRDDQRSYNVIYVDTSDNGSGHARARYSMILFDTSGSMLERVQTTKRTRFDVAKSAVLQSLGNFADGTDHVAVVPFDSHDVVGRIRNAEFRSTHADAAAQVASIPMPKANNNTGLYSAVLTAIPILKQHADSGADVSLIVFTDGVNDVNHREDKDDLDLFGDEGLERVGKAEADARIPVTTVGFGIQDLPRKDFPRAQDALRKMAWPDASSYYDAATNADRLKEIFEITRRSLTERMHIVFGPVRGAQTELSGQTIRFRVRLRTNDTTLESRSEPLWTTVGVGRAVGADQCTDAEAKAIVESQAGPGDSPPPTPMSRLIVLMSFAAALAALWFGAPRFMWPESYIPRPVLPSAAPPDVPGVSFQSAPQPQLPPLGAGSFRGTAPQGRPRPAPPPPSEGGGETIVIPPRGVRAGGGPRVNPAPSEGRRGADEETLYRPPDDKKPNDR
jgi:hypothetical protein